MAHEREEGLSVDEVLQAVQHAPQQNPVGSAPGVDPRVGAGGVAGLGISLQILRQVIELICQAHKILPKSSPAGGQDLPEPEGFEEEDEEV